ncbi:hypothetical protein C8R44DRAFT_989481 [Mycena epipterygia]|nr:hypothetical protein C8R44DRAFT_989481 [Mycena epipterygia]
MASSRAARDRAVTRDGYVPNSLPATYTHPQREGPSAAARAGSLVAHIEEHYLTSPNTPSAPKPSHALNLAAWCPHLEEFGRRVELAAPGLDRAPLSPFASAPCPILPRPRPVLLHPHPAISFPAH